MKKLRSILLLTVVLPAIAMLASLTTKAQSGKLPPFTIMQANGKLYKAEYLPAGKPILLIYFSPDCDHCQKFMEAFFKHTNDFKKAAVVLITFLPVNKVAQFNQQYAVQQFPNIITGTEGSAFFVRNYYKLTQMPFAALHDKNGNLVKTYSKEIPVNDLLEKLKKVL